MNLLCRDTTRLLIRTLLNDGDEASDSASISFTICCKDAKYSLLEDVKLLRKYATRVCPVLFYTLSSAFCDGSAYTVYRCMVDANLCRVGFPGFPPVRISGLSPKEIGNVSEQDITFEVCTTSANGKKRMYAIPFCTFYSNTEVRLSPRNAIKDVSVLLNIGFHFSRLHVQRYDCGFFCVLDKSFSMYIHIGSLIHVSIYDIVTRRMTLQDLSLLKYNLMERDCFFWGHY